MAEDLINIETSENKNTRTSNKKNKVLLGVLVASVFLGIGTGYTLANQPGSKSATIIGSVVNQQPKSAAQDTRTFRDFAEGTIEPMPKPKNPAEYVEGTNLLKRQGATPVALTSSVVDLSQYEGKKVRVYGETQKAIKAGWLMDVGKVEEIK